MWLLDYVTRNTFTKSAPECGDVTTSRDGVVGVNTALELRDVPVVTPYGVVSTPPAGEKTVVLPTKKGDVCLGVYSNASTLQPGELMLCSKGGASIVLKNDGSVLINGKVYGE
ncbi:MAG: phage baseplate assembly protein [Ruminococcus sp.]|nr:phage baseplate assembly protein [Ruminococcus sp.]